MNTFIPFICIYELLTFCFCITLLYTCSFFSLNQNTFKLICRLHGTSSLNTLGQQSPTFLAPGASFVEDGISMDRGRGRGDGSGGNASDGEQHMKLCSLAGRSPPAVRPGS